MGTEVLQRVQGQSPGGGMGTKPPEVEGIGYTLITIAVMC